MRRYGILDALCGGSVSLAHGFVEKDGGSSGSVERFDAAGHGDVDAGVGTALDFFGEAGAFVTDEERHRLAPVHFPGAEERLAGIGDFGDTAGEGADACNF